LVDEKSENKVLGRAMESYQIIETFFGWRQDRVGILLIIFWHIGIGWGFWREIQIQS